MVPEGMGPPALPPFGPRLVRELLAAVRVDDPARGADAERRPFVQPIEAELRFLGRRIRVPIGGLGRCHGRLYGALGKKTSGLTPIS